MGQCAWPRAVGEGSESCQAVTQTLMPGDRRYGLCSQLRPGSESCLCSAGLGKDTAPVDSHLSICGDKSQRAWSPVLGPVSTSFTTLQVEVLPAGPGRGCRLPLLSKAAHPPTPGKVLEKWPSSGLSSFCCFPSYLSSNPCCRPAVRPLITQSDVSLLIGPILNFEETGMSLWLQLA